MGGCNRKQSDNHFIHEIEYERKGIVTDSKRGKRAKYKQYLQEQQRELLASGMDKEQG
jgi:hypothetical protein